MRRQSVVPLLIAPLALLASHSGQGHGPPRRELALLVSTAQHSALRGESNCGHEYGGLPRRQDWLAAMRREHPLNLTLDGGDLVAPDRPHWNGGEARARKMAELTGRLGYDAWTPGELELGYGMDRLTAFVSAVGGTAVSANVLDVTGRRFVPAWTIRTVDGVRVGITGFLDPELLADVTATEAACIATDFQIDEPARATADIVVRLRPEVDCLVVLAHATRDRARTILTGVAGIDLVICGHELNGMDEDLPVTVPAILALRQPRRAGHLVQVALDAMNRPTGFARQDSILGSCRERPGPGNAALAAEIEAFERRQAAEHAVALRDRTDANARQQLDRFTGTEICARCHAGIDDSWRSGAHARAFDSLIRVGRERDAACLPCHVTAWDEPGGFTRFTIDIFDVDRERNPAVRPRLAGVQCEACHGQGTGHGTRRMPATVAEEICTTCHDAVNDPDFDYATAVAGGFHHR